MVCAANASHIGGALSIADLLAVLYGRILEHDPTNPDWSARDRFILSKGHNCVALYATLAHAGFFPISELERYGTDSTRLMAHSSHHVPGVEFSTGSLGHGLPFACGIALSGIRRCAEWRTFALLSDGELNEGSNWEAILFAGHHQLNNLVAIIDYNKIQSLGRVEEVLKLAPLADKFRSFGWQTREIDGHNHADVCTHLDKENQPNSAPLCIIAHTIKGKGVDFMENKLKWHYSSPTQEQLKLALQQIDASE